MSETADVQGEVIGLGTVVAVGFLAYGIVVSETVMGVDTTAAAGGVFAITLLVVALLHAKVGQHDLAWGFGGAASGLLFVFVGTGSAVVIGLSILVLSGLYIVLVTRRLKREAKTNS